MDQALLQIGVGGIFAVLIIRSVLEFLSKRRSSEQTAGEKSIEFWQGVISAIVQQSVQAQIIPTLNEIKDDQKENIEIIRARMREVMSALQVITHHIQSDNK